MKEYEDTKECWENTDITDEDIDNVLSRIDIMKITDKVKLLEILLSFIDKNDKWGDLAEYMIEGL